VSPWDTNGLPVFLRGFVKKMLVGIHAEGRDYLIFKALLAKMLLLDERDLELDPAGIPRKVAGKGWNYVLNNIPNVLKKFYHNCASIAVIGIDNDGDCGVQMTGREDPNKRRHWNHPGSNDNNCRWCQINERIGSLLPQLNWLPGKSSDKWPLIVAVPVEQIESWLLSIEAILHPGRGRLFSENESRSGQKSQFYGRQTAVVTEELIKEKALPLIRNLDQNQIATLKEYSKSFSNFADQIENAKSVIFRGEQSNENPN